MANKFFSMSLTKELSEKIARCAERKGMSKADIHRIALEKYVEEENERGFEFQDKAAKA